MKKTSFCRGYFNLKQKLTMLAGFLFLIFPALLHAQTLKDFDKASEYHEGIELIPYSGIRSAAKPLADDVQRLKREADRHTFSKYEKQKRTLLTEQREINKDLEELHAEFKKREMKVPENDRELKKLQAALNENKEKLADLNEQIEEAARIFRELYEARRGLREQFDRTLDELEDSERKPETHLGKSPSPAQVSELKHAIDVIRHNIKAGASTHQDQEEGARNTAEAMQELLAKTKPF